MCIRNAHRILYSQIAVLFLITSSVLYYVVNNHKKFPVNFRSYDRYLNKYHSKRFINDVTSISKNRNLVPLHKKQLSNDGKIYRFGNCTEEIKLAVVLCGNYLNQTIISLKSVLIFSSKHIHFIIIADDDNRLNITIKLLEWPKEILERLSFEVHPINFPNGTEGEEWRKLFKLCACQRLFLPSLLHNIDSILYVDTDVLFLKPIENLWNHFMKMNGSQIAALCPEHEDFATGWYNRFARHPYYEPLGVNSGIMLMNLTRMRKFQWETYLTPIMKEYKLNIVWGDQDIINIIFHFHSDKLFILPCEWNYRPDHCMYSSVCKSAEKYGIAVLHGNRGVFHNNKQPAFKAIYKAIHQFNLQDIPPKLAQQIKISLDKSVNTRCGKNLNYIFHKNIFP